jgi:catechol 2,3-dioxygenase-like lactoylglutathione lyase family enzyme
MDHCASRFQVYRFGHNGTESHDLIPATAMPDVIGIDHIYIAVTDLARAEAFYDRVMPVLGFRKNRFSIDGDPHVQYFNRHFGYVLRPARSDVAHDPYAAGLHHLCFRVDSIADVGAVASQLKAAGIQASAPRVFPDYAPDYWATFFSDPDGLRLEVTNYRAERRQRHDEWDDL